MNKVFYIPDEKKDLLDRAVEISTKKSLSATIRRALEYFIEEKSNSNTKSIVNRVDDVQSELGKIKEELSIGEEWKDFEKTRQKTNEIIEQNNRSKEEIAEGIASLEYE